MPVIEYSIYVEAPREQCFDLTRNVDVHVQTTSKTKERAIGGVTSGLMEEGDTVTWQATHLGVKQKLTAQITAMDRPYQFTDVMVKGAFHSFTHTHTFTEQGTGTWMKDRFEYRSPFGPLGTLADKLFLEAYMTRFIVGRAEEIKKIAEAGI